MTVDVDEKKNSSKFKREARSTSKRKHDGAEQEEDGDDNTNPIPSTSGSSKQEPSTGMKKYKKSLPFIQYNWCTQQPEFLTLRDELSTTHK